MQAYLGIHQPENVDMADSARRRLIFDDFFYLQVIGLLSLKWGIFTLEFWYHLQVSLHNYYVSYMCMQFNMDLFILFYFIFCDLWLRSKPSYGHSECLCFICSCRYWHVASGPCINLLHFIFLLGVNYSARGRLHVLFSLCMHISTLMSNWCISSYY